MPKKIKEESKTIPTDMITEEMREAVGELGEKSVVATEGDAMELTPEDQPPQDNDHVAEGCEKFSASTYLGHEIHGDVSDHTHDGRAYKKFSTANGQTWMVTPEDFEKGLS